MNEWKWKENSPLGLKGKREANGRSLIEGFGVKLSGDGEDTARIESLVE